MRHEMFSVHKAENGFVLKMHIPYRPEEECYPGKSSDSFVFETEEKLLAKITELMPKMAKGFDEYMQDFDSAFKEAVKG